MKNAFKVVLALCLLASSANAVTVYGNSAQLNAAGSATDCTGVGAGAGTNAKAVALALPPWAGTAQISIIGTFVATYGFFVSIDGVNYVGSTALPSTNHTVAGTSTGQSNIWTVMDLGARYVCVALTAYTSGTVPVVIEPLPAAASTFVLASGNGATAGTLSLGTAVTQGAANSSNAALAVSIVANLGINSTPAVNTQASASIAAGGATLRHIAGRCSGSINTVAAQTALALNLRDGATGAGTIVWSAVTTCALGASCVLDSGPINIIGTAATAMTCEWSGIPAVGNFEVANLEYKNAG